MVIYCDGATRRVCFVPAGHPPYVVELEELATNNQAEYWAVLAALYWAADNQIDHVKILSDSQLVINQINRTYAIKNKRLSELARMVWGQVIKMKGEITFCWIPREENEAGIILG